MQFVKGDVNVLGCVWTEWRQGLLIPVLQVQLSLCMGDWRFSSTH